MQSHSSNVIDFRVLLHADARKSSSFDEFYARSFFFFNKQVV